MALEPIFVGKRKLQAAGRAFRINVPPVVVTAFGWNDHDELDITIEHDGSMKVRRVQKDE